MRDQLWLPIFKPWNRPTVIDPVVKRHVDECIVLFRALQILGDGLARILSNPSAHWRRIVEMRGGKRRVCHAPDEALASVQRRLAKWLRRRVPSSYVATAYERGGSVVVNAKRHRYGRSSWRLDITDAFASIEAKHIRRFILRHHEDWNRLTPLLDNPIDCMVVEYPAKELAWVLSRVFTYRGRLPQGAGSSPRIFNLMMRRFDEDLLETLAGRVVYTRYGDDLCFSSPEEIFPPDTKLAILEVCRRHHLRLNPKKTREDRGDVLEFPGAVIVRRRIRPTGGYIARLARRSFAGTLSAKSRHGHRGFLGQFGHEGRLPILKHLIS